jgi:uncharacterized membrane protein YbjE (DUF340 family)
MSKLKENRKALAVSIITLVLVVLGLLYFGHQTKGSGGFCKSDSTYSIYLLPIITFIGSFLALRSLMAKETRTLKTILPLIISLIPAGLVFIFCFTLNFGKCFAR